jgi:2-polyprenyl-3-methyl-5-hydroxy-6-metoxy-1,4-benzoquinol methylase
VTRLKARRIIDSSPIVERARLSAGRSERYVYDAVVKVLSARLTGVGSLVDIGCGTGELWKVAGKLFSRYIGIDLVRYDGFPNSERFVSCNLEDYSISLPSEVADTVVALETIEHLDNPRAFMRELVRLVKPGGWIVVTTPNQLSILSKMTLVLKNQFNAFQEASYPCHRTALLEIDLIRIATESGLSEIAIEYTNRGRIPFSSKRWPRVFQGRSFSDNVLIAARKPDRVVFSRS